MLNIARTLQGFALAVTLLVPSLGLAAAGHDHIKRDTAKGLASSVVTSTYGRPASSDGYKVSARRGSNQHVMRFSAFPYWRGPAPMTFVAIPSRLGTVKLDKTATAPTGARRVTLDPSGPGPFGAAAQ